MNSPALHKTIGLGFLATLGVVPLVQIALEVGRGQWPLALDLFEQKPTVSHLRAYDRALEESNWLGANLRPWTQHALWTLFRDAGSKALVGRDGWLFYRPGVQFLTHRPKPGPGSGTASEAAAAIAHFRDQLADRGATLLVVPVPNKESIYPEKLSRRAVRTRPGVGPETSELMERLKAAGIETVDLFSAFGRAKSAEAAPGPALYLARDTHWSPAGVELAARTVAARVFELGQIQMGSVAYGLRPASVQRVGDLLQMLQVPSIERAAAPETVPCTQVVRADTNELYQDDPEAPVLVLGDSFLRIYEQDEPQAAGFVAHLARELQQPVVSLVSDGGASTLVRQELNLRPALLKNKKLVIWEFTERDIRLGTEGWQKVPVPGTSPQIGHMRDERTAPHEADAGPSDARLTVGRFFPRTSKQAHRTARPF